MNKKSFFLMLCFLTGTYSFVSAQLSVTTGMTATQYVEDVLLGGGVTVSNISYTGHLSAIGKFQTGTTPTNLGLTNGLVLSTGLANGNPAIGSGGSNFASTDNSTSGYALLTTIAGNQTYDAAVLEFDFFPLSDTIKFKYVFGSEEYPEFVCSNYNDVFGFFITGPNPTGGNYNNYNIARIPNTTLPVAINTVNPGTPGGSYPASGCSSLAYSQYYVNNGSGSSVVFDGFTHVFQAWAKVTPCVNYRIRIAIADAGDGIYDSAVFLEANSFGTSAFNADVSYTLPGNNNHAIEGCTGADAILNFSIPNPMGTDFTLNYTIAGTAQNCTDYVITPGSNCLPNSITIPAGQTSNNLQIHALDDGITEGNETIYLIFTNSCGVSDTVTVNIIDYTPPLATGYGSTSFCESTINQTQIGVNVADGVSPYIYTWDNGLPPSNSTIVSPSETTTYTVTVTDFCLTTASSNVTITINPDPDLTITATPSSLCLGDTAILTANGATNYNWVELASGQNPISVSPILTTTYTLIGTLSGTGCSSQETVTITVNPDPTVLFSGDTLSGCTPVTVNFSETSSDTDISTWLWDFGDGTTSDIKNPVHTYTTDGSYNVNLTLTNNSGCSSVLQLNNYINSWPQPLADFYTVPDVGKVYAPTLTFYSTTTAQTWDWNFGNGSTSSTPPPVQYTYPATENTYTVTLIVSNQYGCADTIVKEVQIIDDVLQFPNVITPNGDGNNDLFVITNATKYPNNSLVVFNRWGKKVFEQENYDNTWYGEGLSDGVYYYIFKYLDKSYQSSLTILRTEK